MKNDIIKEGYIKGTREQSLVPELRFPEFKKEWETDSMQSIFDMKNGYTPSKSNPTYWDNGTIPWFRMEDIRKNGHILSDSIQHVTPQAIKNSGLFPAYSIIVATTATIGEHALIIVDSLANQRFTFLTKRKSFEDKIDMMYFHHYMFVIDEWCKKNTNCGGLISVNMPAFKQLLIPFPSPNEQSKIAGCLSSIDEEISAMKEKVEQLKTHKKGLMQKLFPVGGKYIPALRFPEFRESASWDFVNGDNLFVPIVNKNHNSDLPILAITQDKGAVPRNLIDYKVIVSDNSIKSYKIVEVGDFIISLRSFQGGIEYSNYKGLCSPAYIVLRKISDTIYNDFYRHYLKSANYILELNRNIEGIRDGKMISYLQFSNIKLPFPSPEEQQKIAECLSSVEKLISLYESKVSLLERHKKGLMQQLFPKL